VDEALRSLPERVYEDERMRFCAQHGITIDMLKIEKGGSPGRRLRPFGADAMTASIGHPC
jgi:hypothetical protein